MAPTEIANGQMKAIEDLNFQKGPKVKIRIRVKSFFFTDQRFETHDLDL